MVIHITAILVDLKHGLKNRGVRLKARSDKPIYAINSRDSLINYITQKSNLVEYQC